MSTSVAGALTTLWRIGEERSARCKDEAGQYRAWLAERAVTYKAKLTLERSEPSKRQRLEAGAVDLKCFSREPGAEAQASLPLVQLVPQVAAGAENVQSALLQPLHSLQPPARALAGDAAQQPTAPVQPAPENAAHAGGQDKAERLRLAQLALLQAAVQVPLPGSTPPPASPADFAPPAASGALQPAAATAAKRPPAKPAAQPAAELSQKREEQIELERRQKKEELVRQREAARQAALQKGPEAASKATVEPSATALVGSLPPPAAPKAEHAMALPRLKQMIEAKKMADRLQMEQSAKGKEDVMHEQEPLEQGAQQSPKREDASKHVARSCPPDTVLEPPQQRAGAGPQNAAAGPEQARAPPRPPARHIEVQSYEISPYKSGSDSENEEERPRKPVPAWALSDALGPVLYAQARADPDSIFIHPARTCSLTDVFQCAGNKKRDFSRRGSSGNWEEDQLTQAEELAFRERHYAR